MPALPFLLTVPWGLYAETPISGAAPRVPLRDGATAQVMAAHGLMLAIPTAARVLVAGRRLRMQQEGAPFDWAQDRFAMHALPSGIRPEERTLALAIGAPDTEMAASIELDGYLAKPQKRQSDAPANDGDRIQDFILKVLSRIREAEASDGERPAGGVAAWSRIAAAWTTTEANALDAPKELIVEHAETYRRVLMEVAQHPRRVLARVRRPMPLDRVQEIDKGCIDWLIRQPGTSIEEKAGPRQAVLGIAREENLNTLENRVLKDLLRHSTMEANGYLRANKRYAASERYRLVAAYAGLCRRTWRELEAQGIADPTHPVTPNYVLQHDARYRSIWKAYQEVLGDERRQDDTWRWQRRLWSDFVRLSVHIALGRIRGCRPVALSPLRIRREQGRGRWSDLAQQSGLFLLRRPGRDLAISVLDATLPDGHPSLRPWQHALGATIVLAVEDCATGRQAAICVWPIHGTGSEPIALQEFMASADEALRIVVDEERRYRDVREEVRGLVIRSSLDMANPDWGQQGRVYGLAMGPSAEMIEETMEMGAMVLEDAITSLHW
ncbi:hypothetical protein VY88_10145 [Azospirillum thiophilum]|uniref:DUF2357 domain-containing protein n=1 Tax=Azospirillum thiophilum TaxID=528244 RepID=A0AAC8VV19_9PROT|nr:DUF2357 domain-containing protein [Azospirillum thiophilum]ALG69989.1 hypothetical protein AL072_02570 [Azospirillum thiophilum]KJR66327.1 hypothetical protein VY88_10145 [Azospirillum thiophilum]